MNFSWSVRDRKSFFSLPLKSTSSGRQKNDSCCRNKSNIFLYLYLSYRCRLKSSPKNNGCLVVSIFFLLIILLIYYMLHSRILEFRLFSHHLYLRNTRSLHPFYMSIRDHAQFQTLVNFRFHIYQTYNNDWLI